MARRQRPEERLAAGLAVATVPVILAGLLLTVTTGTDSLRSATLIGWTTLLFDLLLRWFDRRGVRRRDLSDWTLGQALKLGLWQAIALMIPGTSRSGIRITGVRAMGYGREEAAHISMLMSIPTIMVSGPLPGLEIVKDANTALARNGAIAADFSFVAALAVSHLMLRLLRNVSFMPNALVILGVGLLTYVYATGQRARLRPTPATAQNGANDGTVVRQSASMWKISNSGL